MILVVDNYDSFTYNLVHLVARHTAAYRVVRNDEMTVREVQALAPDLLLLSPGPGRPADAGITPDLVREVSPGVPTLGVCLGHQAIGEAFGGAVVHAPTLMHGKTSEVLHENAGIFAGLPAPFTATRYHSLTVQPDSVPDELEVTAWTADGVVMGLKHRTLPIEGVQFHPESILTVEGPKLIANWIGPVRPAPDRPRGDPALP